MSAQTALILHMIKIMLTLTCGIDGTAKFCVLWVISLEQFVINSARLQFVPESVQGATKGVFLWSWTITNTRLSCILVACQLLPTFEPITPAHNHLSYE